MAGIPPPPPPAPLTNPTKWQCCQCCSGPFLYARTTQCEGGTLPVTGAICTHHFCRSNCKKDNEIKAPLQPKESSRPYIIRSDPAASGYLQTRKTSTAPISGPNFNRTSTPRSCPKIQSSFGNRPSLRPPFPTTSVPGSRPRSRAFTSQASRVSTRPRFEPERALRSRVDHEAVCPAADMRGWWRCCHCKLVCNPGLTSGGRCQHCSHVGPCVGCTRW